MKGQIDVSHLIELVIGSITVMGLWWIFWKEHGPGNKKYEALESRVSKLESEKVTLKNKLGILIKQLKNKSSIQ